MAYKQKKLVFFVDDEIAVCKAAEKTLKQLNCGISCFTDPAQCLDELKTQNCDLLITDLKMPGIDGIQLLQKAKQLKPGLPVLTITGYADIEIAVNAIKAGASDFIEKPLQKEKFLSAVKTILDKKISEDPPADNLLTKTEKMILKIILQGKSNKEVAHILHRSRRTIEDHRAHIMRKLNVSNAVELTERAIELGLLRITNTQ